MHPPTLLPNELDVEFELRGEQLRQVFVLAAKHSGLFRRAVFGGWIILGVLAGICLFLLWRFAEPRYMVGLALVSLAIAALYPFVLPRLLLAGYREPDLSAFGPIRRVRIKVTRCELFLASGAGQSTHALHTVTLKTGGDFLVVLFSDGSFIVVPKDGDFGRESFESFCDKLQRLVDEARFLSGTNVARG